VYCRVQPVLDGTNVIKAGWRFYTFNSDINEERHLPGEKKPLSHPE